MLKQLANLMRASNRRGEGYSRDLQTARLRASYQRPYFAPALFALVPVRTDLIDSMAVDAYWRLYFNESWLAAHNVEENASLLIHEVSHLLRDHEARKTAAAARDARLWNTAADCEINDDLAAEGLPLPGDPPQPQKYGMPPGATAESYYQTLSKPQARQDQPRDCGSGAHGDHRPWELPPEQQTSGGTPGVDAVKAAMVRRDVAQRIIDTMPFAGEVPLGWRRWAHAMMTPQVDYMAILRRTVRTALRESTLGRYDRTYRRPHRRRAYGDFILPSFYQPRPRPGFLIDTSASMQDVQLSRAITELGALTRQLGFANDVVVACCDAAVHGVRKVFNPERVELIGGGGTDLRRGLEWFAQRTGGAIDLLIVVTDCETAWPEDAPPFPVITIRVGRGLPPPWGHRGSNQVITIEDREQLIQQSIDRDRRRGWWRNAR